ncbi:hypothetical protein [Aneurinibacillus migulanus]|uniref:hypothetical protein n=1 Tax=Aneurinibacillus migulanus TaxID=47500 RepID=UPI0020A1B042|nr:hypothetical protein [Aneurinibacillus migulanus]MCP1354598.1 hypothetical protein [Aneurinibacillus migulanus]
MALYKAGDIFKNTFGEESVKMTIIFVPSLDGYGVQYYLVEVFSIYANGGEKCFYDLAKEYDITKRFIKKGNLNEQTK